MSQRPPDGAAVADLRVGDMRHCFRQQRRGWDAGGPACRREKEFWKKTKEKDLEIQVQIIIFQTKDKDKAKI